MLQGQSWWSSHLWWLVASLYVLRPPAIMFSMSHYLQWCWIPHPGPARLPKPDRTMLFKPQEVFLPLLLSSLTDPSSFNFIALWKLFSFRNHFIFVKFECPCCRKKKSSVLKPMADRMPQVENSMLDLRQQVAVKRQTAQIIKNIVWNCLRARCLRCRWNINELSV